uniref:Uncharacterized protein n=1 Tax=Phlebotomus papatasi TaxID=29031 RepID=A0A1B0DBJ2_PHLPP
MDHEPQSSLMLRNCLEIYPIEISDVQLVAPSHVIGSQIVADVMVSSIGFRSLGPVHGAVASGASAIGPWSAPWLRSQHIVVQIHPITPEIILQTTQKIDPEGFGEIPVDDFINALKTPEIQAQVPLNKRELLLERALKSKGPKGSGSVSFQEFVNVG